MKQVATTASVAPALLKALGLDGQHITKLVITLDVGEPVQVDVTRHIGFDEVNQAISEFTPYNLVPKE